MKRQVLTAAFGGAIMGWAATRWRHRRFFPLGGRVALVTGGSRGLGLVIARRLLRNGARVAICARDANELNRAETDLRRFGPSVLSLRCDVTDYAEVIDAIRRIRETWGPVDLLINNAGVMDVGPMDAMTIADYDQAFKTHFWGPLHTTLAVLPGMRRRGGRIVNITSIGGKISVPHMLPYSSSKFALVGFSEGLRAALKKDRVYVTTVCPGLMRTGSPVNAAFKAHHRAEFAWFSIAEASPLLSIAAERAADRILRAAQWGEAEVTLSWPAKIAVFLHGLSPALVSDTLALVDRLLPGRGGIGAAERRGSESQSALSPSVLTRLSDEAAQRNNELSPPRA